LIVYFSFLGLIMTYRLYARYADQSVTHKTNTESKAVADAAWEELKRIKWDADNKPIGLAYNCNGEKVDYVDLS
jgi:hypothetical protein